MKTYLKIKIKSLAAEAVIIKQEERKWKQWTVFRENERQPHSMYFALRQHRLLEVRKECRAAILAYGYLRGRAYKQIEAICYEKPDWTRVAELVYKYGNGIWKNSNYTKEYNLKLVIKLLKAWSLGEEYSVPDTGFVKKLVDRVFSSVA